MRDDGRSMLLTDRADVLGDDEPEFFAVDAREDPCYRESLLLLDQSLMEGSSKI